MENDNQLGLIDLKEKDYFILEYPNQSLKHNKNFKDFKAQKLIELGADAKLFKCKQDNILFYIQKKDNETFPYYYKKCPKCNKNICYFCGRNTNSDKGECCIRRRVYYLFFYNGFYFFNENVENLDEDYNEASKCIFIPIFGLMFFIYCMGIILFYDMILYTTERYVENSLMTYYEYLKKYYSYNLISFIHFGCGFCAIICYSIVDINFKIILFLFSLFTKFYPLKYFMGMLLS